MWRWFGMTLFSTLATLYRSVVAWCRRAKRRQLAATLELQQLRSRLASFRQARLTVELVPATSWGANLRTVLPKADWDRLRKRAYRDAGYRCEICRERGPTHPVECHELWEYDDTNGVQRLLGLIALCPSCHAVKHLGLSYAEGDGDAAFARLMRVNGWSAALARMYVDLVFEIWTIRSKMEWRLDLRWLTSRGIEPPKSAR